jgi:site-specific recombinase XerD
MSVYKRNGSPYWYFSYTINGQRIEGSTKTTSKTEAKKFAEATKTDFLRGQHEIKVVKKNQFESLVNKFLEWSKSHRKSSSYKRDVVLTGHLLEFFEKRDISDISNLDVEVYQNHREQSVSKSTVNREVACLRRMYNLDKAWKMVDGNPVNEWSQVDFDTSYITIEESKTDEYRKVKMNSVVIGVLKSLKRNGEYVFSNQNGEPFQRINKAFKSVCKRAGLKPATPHAMRHTFASHLVKLGVDLYTVMELGGWKSLEMVMRYSHLAPDHKQMAVNKLAAMKCLTNS